MFDPLPFTEMEPNFCSRDGTPLGDELKAGKLRRVCPTCGYMYGRDPRVILGLLISWGDDLLFVQRSQSAREVWSLPLYPCRDREDARLMTSKLFESETGLQAQAGSVVDTFNIDNSELGSVLVLLFRGTLARDRIAERANLTAANPAMTLSGWCTDLTTEVLKRLSGAGATPSPDQVRVGSD